MKISHALMLAFSISSLALVACTKKSEAPATSEAPAAQATASAPAAAPAAATAVDPNKKPDVEVVIGTEGDAMAFDKKEFEVKAGATVKITFKNNAAKGGLQHNLLVVKPGTEQTVANASIQAGSEKGWSPDADPNVLVKTKLVNPQESDSIVFVAPAAGDYPYICTFPGHSMIMKGTMHVK